jgi:hypothetical protein
MMSALEVMLAIVGFTVTTLVVVGMILITPRGEVDLHDADASDPQGSDLSRAGMPSAPVRRAVDDDPVEEERIAPSSPAARAP